MAEKFILHVEVLFATIDDLEWHFAQLTMKGNVTRAPMTLVHHFSHDRTQACHMFGKPACSAARP